MPYQSFLGASSWSTLKKSCPCINNEPKHFYQHYLKSLHTATYNIYYINYVFVLHTTVSGAIELKLLGCTAAPSLVTQKTN